MADIETETRIKVTEARKFTPEELWNLDMLNDNDAGAQTIGDFMLALLRALWIKEEGFSGKRPLGNSGWKHQVYEALLLNGAITGEYVVYSDDENDYTEIYECDDETGDILILEMINNLTVKS